MVQKEEADEEVEDDTKEGQGWCSLPPRGLWKQGKVEETCQLCANPNDPYGLRGKTTLHSL